MKIIPALIIALILFCVGCTTPLPADFQVTPVNDAVVGNNPMVHQKGTLIVDPNGEPLKLRGVLLEGWLQWNGPLWGVGLTSETTISNKLEQLAGAGEFQAFRKGIYDNFITERDIEIIAGLGLNVVRVPINHHILESPSGAPDYEAAGWEYLDRLLEWCEQHEVYVVLDLHSAPGGQSGVFVADPDEKKL
jgi:aryl-phospho-beta-D-glucosidase BglC (GH1 family)